MYLTNNESIRKQQKMFVEIDLYQVLASYKTGQSILTMCFFKKSPENTFFYKIKYQHKS